MDIPQFTRTNATADLSAMDKRAFAYATSDPDAEQLGDELACNSDPLM